MIADAHREWLAIGLLALSPLAYVGSMWIERALPARTVVSAIDATEAVRIASDVARSRQIDTEGWESLVGTDKNDKLVQVFRKLHPASLEGVAAPSTIKVQLQTAGGDRWFRTTLTPQGKAIGFQESKAKNPTPVDAAGARALAESAMNGWMGSKPSWHLEYRERSGSDDDKQDRVFTWRAPVPGLAKATATFHIDMYGNRVTGERTSITVSDSLSDQLNPGSGWLTFLKVLAWAYIVLLGIYSIVRYVRRSIDKEISHQRTVLAALAFVLMSSLFLFDPGYLASQLGTDLESQRTGIVILMIVGYSLVGAFFGVAYGAGEGALRETYPGKITSLDALLSGKLNSTNVARSILVGGGIAGWLLLVQNGLLLAVHGSRVGSDHDILTSTFYRLPLLALIGERAADAVLQTTFGLLLPIALLRPRIKKSWIFFALMPLFSILPATLTAGDEALWSTFFSLQLAIVAACIVPFFSDDLLAAIASMFALRFVGALVQRGVVSAEWERIFLWEVAPAGIVFLLAQVYFAWRGPTYEEFEVRPRYARFLVEHQALEAEIGAARLAQLRLLPAAAPRVDGLSIAGACIPAREVGGDFYDFYEIDSHRLGVFMAEGGSRELGSAMPIALAKGYLLYASGLDLAPAEMVRRLKGVMGTALHGDASMSVLYAVLDTHAHTVRWARTGVSPRLLINGTAMPEEVADGDRAVRHGTAPLALTDTLFLYTDGLANQIVERKHQWADRFLQKLVRKWPSWSADDLQNAILRAALRGKQHPPDDVTSVVIRVEERTVRAMEVVA
ncbi:MAG TPA: SpoIIE family protein phosphatase [Bryobacteraceae bacterium]|jgi:hypothetical protein|nr:SpoIIE family protein phosphatase [Bryobacteraceae bacterium]